MEQQHVTAQANEVARPMPQLGSPLQFATLRETFARCEFTPATLRRAQTSKVLREASRDMQSPVVDEPCAILLARLFVRGEPVSKEHFGNGVLKSVRPILEDLGLIIETSANEPSYRATVLLQPMDNLYITSDWSKPLPNSGDMSAYETVYNPFDLSARNFISMMPCSPCETFLELCAGAGLAAIRAASEFAQRVWACDLNPRAASFAAFNQRLNNLSNIVISQGDLYEPVAGLEFDRIVAHPPYVPLRHTSVLYRDGSANGEAVTERIVRGLPKHLREGGLFYGYAMLNDRVAEPCECRLQKWLGSDCGKFTISVVTSEETDPQTICAQLVAKGWMAGAQAADHLARLEDCGVVRFVKCWFVIRRVRLGEEPSILRQSASEVIQRGILN